MAASHGRVGRPGFRVAHRIIPPHLILERPPFRVTAPALTALDLITETQSAPAIDEVRVVREILQALETTKAVRR